MARHFSSWSGALLLGSLTSLRASAASSVTVNKDIKIISRSYALQMVNCLGSFDDTVLLQE